MRKFFYGTAILLLTASMAFAQTSTTPDQTAPPSSQTPSTTPDQTAPSSSQTPTSSQSGNSIQGCLSGSDPNYTLTDQSCKTWMLQADGQDLKSHVGHTVGITGQPAAAGEAG